VKTRPKIKLNVKKLRTLTPQQSHAAAGGFTCINNSACALSGENTFGMTQAKCGNRAASTC
jgi:hypothetical protein